MPENCKRCGKPMIIMHWNSNTDVFACDNSSCRFFRQPTPTPISDTTLAEELGGVYSRHKRRPKEKRKYAAFTFEEKLQELRDNIST